MPGVSKSTWPTRRFSRSNFRTLSVRDEGDVPERAVRLDRGVVGLGRRGEAELLQVDRLHETVRRHVDDGDRDVLLAGHVQVAPAPNRRGPAGPGRRRTRRHRCQAQPRRSARRISLLGHGPRAVADDEETFTSARHRDDAALEVGVVRPRPVHLGVVTAVRHGVEVPHRNRVLRVRDVEDDAARSCSWTGTSCCRGCRGCGPWTLRLGHVLAREDRIVEILGGPRSGSACS